MTEDDFHEALIAWGRLLGSGKAPSEDRSLTGNSPLAAMIGKRKEPDRSRYGQDRRRMMGSSAGLRGMVPTWAVDNIPCGETRSSCGAVDDAHETPVLVRVQSAWLALWRDCEPHAQAVRMHYQERSLSRDDKARKLGVSVRAYRAAVADGRAAMFTRMRA